MCAALQVGGTALQRYSIQGSLTSGSKTCAGLQDCASQHANETFNIGNLISMHSLFKRLDGMTPGDYHERHAPRPSRSDAQLD